MRHVGQVVRHVRQVRQVVRPAAQVVVVVGHEPGLMLTLPLREDGAPARLGRRRLVCPHTAPARVSGRAGAALAALAGRGLGPPAGVHSMSTHMRSAEPPMCMKVKISMTHHSRCVNVGPTRSTSCWLPPRKMGRHGSVSVIRRWSRHHLSIHSRGCRPCSAANARPHARSCAYL